MPSSSFLHRTVYETIVAFITLSTFPLIVAIVAPLATLARLLSFIVREFRIMRNASSSSSAQYLHHKIAASHSSTSATMSETTKFISSSSSSSSSSAPSSAKERVLANLARSAVDDDVAGGGAELLITSRDTAHPNSSDCIVIVNAASSFEAEGLVRYYAARGCTVIACDKNQQQMSEIFRNEDQNLVKTISVTTPESAVRVKDFVSQYCSTQFNPEPLALYAIIFVEPNGEVVMRRALEREFFLGNNDFRKFFPISSSSSSSSNSNSATTKSATSSIRATSTATNVSTSTSSSSSSSSSTSFTSAEVVFLLSEFLTRTSGGSVPDFGLILAKRIEEEQKQQQKSGSSTGTTGKNKTSSSSTSSPFANSKSDHRRTSSLDASALLSSSSAMASGAKKSTSSSSSAGFAQTFTRSLSEQTLESFVFNPLRTQTAILRELVPLALRSSMNSHHQNQQQQQTPTKMDVVGGVTNATSSSKDEKQNSNNKSNTQARRFSINATSSLLLSSSSSSIHHQPRICVITRKDEDERLSTALSLLNYSNSLSLSSLLLGTETGSSSSSTAVGSGGSSSSSSSSLLSMIKLLNASVSTFAGIGKMRRMLSQSLLDVCEEVRLHCESSSSSSSLSSSASSSSSSSSGSSSSSSSFDRSSASTGSDASFFGRIFSSFSSSSSKSKRFVRWCHIELFSTSAQQASQKRWMQHLMEFYFSSPSASRKPSTRNRWRVPRVIFSQDPYAGYFNDFGDQQDQPQQHETANHATGSDPKNASPERRRATTSAGTAQSSSTNNFSPSSSSSRLAGASATAASVVSSSQQQRQQSKSQQAIENERQDLINCSNQISFLGDTINTVKPKRATYTSPKLSLNEGYRTTTTTSFSSSSSTSSTQQRRELSSLLHDIVEDEAGPSASVTAAYSHVIDDDDDELYNESMTKFVPLSFWTRVISWSLREERMLDVMMAGFHSSTKVEQTIKRVFEYVCS